ncbi:MAG: riboflavin synthase [SAR202 cluster bacterium]|jgi:riboflavin synthase|nr:riboflavin synthase [SAR202 cluster bacterium]MDP7105173.1 riboflavin synthase [SAR202 cluster bacterium]MDP7415096.1 riboflavin synthase [SAR202 cluster bacterium]|tara:strand:- start:1809 stop:2387 length:579 start_codon:yes stop_codon:yes gene_type:complete
MFTGIVEEVGTVQSTSTGRLSIGASTVMDDLSVSDSISINGTCLTVTVRDDNGFSVDVVPETLRRTNLSDLTAGDSVNLERPMKADDRFGGHIVQGHVDGTGAIESIEPEGEALLVRFTANDAVMRYVVEKGFITVDGASLTVVNCDDFGFLVSIIPYTRDNTKFATWKPGDTVNLEIDVIAKYVEKLSTRS